MRSRVRFLTIIALLPLAICGCNKPKEAEDVRPVRTVVVGSDAHKASGVVTGQVTAHAYVNAAFRIPGKLAQRMVSAGSAVKAGQLLARLDDTVYKDALASANAEVAGARAALELAQKLEGRNSNLLQQKAVSQNAYDETLRQLKSTRAELDSAEAKARIAKEQLDYTLLKAEADGIVTDRLAEVGEVVTAGQAVFRIGQNNLKDALFEMPEDIIRGGLALGQKIETCLDRNRNVCTTASVYEIAPEADSVTRTYQTKAVLENNASQMLLGSTVIGRFAFTQKPTLEIPASALTTFEGKPAAWLVDPSTQSVSLRAVDVALYTTDKVILLNGLSAGDRIVTAGIQSLRQAQKVRAMEDDREVR
ncbi:MAG TPA: efflux RND transporter periplasmic adaptor subunit [Syntrophales bacterium]|nr:efflux RND transporter periplasmic adaptor subunit [Syntrophales bacterium]